MTDLELIEYYKNLIIIQYRKEKAEGHIEAMVKQIVLYEIIDAIKNGYNIEDAVGVQLDVLGKYIGLNRDLSNGESIIENDDAYYRTLLKFKIIKNYSNHSLKSIDDLLYLFYEETIKYFDYESMEGLYSILDNTANIDIAKIAKHENLLPKSMGVLINIEAHVSNPFVFYGDDDGEGFGKLSDDDYALMDSEGNTVLDSEGNTIFVLVNEADPDAEGGAFAVVLD